MSIALGATTSAGKTLFAVRARDAKRLTLCLFDGDDERPVPMTRQDDVHIAEVTQTGPGQRYGFRAEGPWDPANGFFFDRAKLLVDPYAVTLDSRFAFDTRLALRGIDTAALVPKAVVPHPFAPLPHTPPHFRPGGLIYELNVRGFTRNHPDVPPSQRGTIAALAHPAVIAHFRKLNVAAIELMPIVAWIDERHLPPLGLQNCWGYNPVTLMALDPGLAPGGVAELRQTVAALHKAGIGVFLDLVFNHTGESDLLGPTLSLRGLENHCYAHTPEGALVNDTGTGNTLKASEPAVHNLILAALRHFAGNCGVDGFRFDLAPVLARTPAFNPQAPIFAAIAEDPVLADRIMIAEPWDIGPGGYQLGNFPSHWLEWNDRYRDDVRRFWRGDPGTLGPLATRMMGSSDVFGDDKTRSVNFIAAHDGFTIADVTAYAQKHNLANGEGDRDGHNENFSWNNGVEGRSGDSDVRARRAADIRALLATLFATKGVIQLTAGDEFGRSQGGNNNAYAQDNDTTWINWADRDLALEDFTAALAAARARLPDLADPAWLVDADWRGLDDLPMTPEKWESAQTDGFVLRLPGLDGGVMVIRVDRRQRYCGIDTL